MGTSFNFEIKLAGREWSRQFYTAVVKSLSKTITEPITNSDTSYKRKLNLPDASGLVEVALSIEKGKKFDLSACKEKLYNSALQRTIEVHIYTARGHGRKPRTCEIVDFAEGLNVNELQNAFKLYAADKSGVSKGRPGRSLFGRGVSDVLLGHRDGEFFGYRAGVLSKLAFAFDSKVDSQPRALGTEIEKISTSALKDYHLRPSENGCCVRFVLNEDCRIHEEGSIVQILAQFYMLRLINADPNITVKLFRYRAGGKVYEDRLVYDFPIGDVVEKLSFSIQEPVQGAQLPPLQIDGIVCRADVQGGLPGREAGEQRANGLLIVDDRDAVLDLTFLPRFEDAPYLRNIFGLIRIKNIREVFDWYLNNGKDSPLTTSRDGFDPRHDVAKKLYDALYNKLEPVYRREEERFNKAQAGRLSGQTRERLDEAIKELNKLLKDLIGEGTGAGPDDNPRLDPDKPLQFLPATTRLILGRPRFVKLYFKKELAEQKGSILIESNNPKIEIRAASQLVSEGRREDNHLVYVVSLQSDSLGENATVTALADGIGSTFEAVLEVLDVTESHTILPPEEMEFRPKVSRGEPSRVNNLTLLINTKVIPLGRKIRFEIQKAQGGVGLLEGSKKVEETSVTFEKLHLIPGTEIGRILIPWRGAGWGQSAGVVATTKKPDSSLAYAHGRIVLEEQQDAGIIKDVRYQELGNQKCSDLVDGIIYINSGHYLNRFVFGTEQQYTKRIEEDHTAQYRLSLLMVEQSVFRLAEESYLESKLVLNDRAPVTSLREFIDQKTHQFGPKIINALVIK